MKKVFITGGSGFIGRNLVEKLKLNYKVYSPKSDELDLLDSAQVEKFLSKNKFDLVIHTATHNATKTSDKDLNIVFKNNIRMFFNLARNKNKFKKMFYFGSGAEFDARFYRPKMSEDYFDTFVPIDDYGFSKYIMAKYVQKTENIYNLRLFGVVGKYEDWRIRFISNNICRGLFGLDLTLSKNMKFDYLYIDDLAKIIDIFFNKKKLKFNTYNICTGKTSHLLKIAKIIQKKLPIKVDIKLREKGMKNEYSGNNKRLLGEIGDFKFTPIDEIVSNLVKFYIDNKKTINKKELSLA